MTDGKGHITIEHTIWCAGCINWVQEPEPTKKSMGALMTRRGWKNTTKSGWLCPRCQELEKNA